MPLEPGQPDQSQQQPQSPTAQAEPASIVSTTDNFETAFSTASASAAAQPQSQPTSQAASPAQVQANTSTPAPPATSQPSPELLQQAKSLGIDLSQAKSEADIARAVLQHYQQVAPYVQYGRQLAPHSDQIREWLEGQQQATQAKQPAEPAEEEWKPDDYFKSHWQTPEWNQQFSVAIQQGYVQRNPETGAWEPAPGYELLAAPIVQNLNQFQVAQQQQLQDLFRGNPFAKFHDVLIEPMRRAWQEDLRKMLADTKQEQQHTDTFSKYDQDNSAWLYATSVNGERTFTAEGQKMFDTMQRLRQHGMTDPVVLLQTAEEIVRPTKGQPVPAQTAAAPAPGMPNPPVAPAPVQDPKVASAQHQRAFLDNALDRARHSPNSGGFTQASPDHPTNVSEGELDQLFVNTLRASQAA